MKAFIRDGIYIPIKHVKEEHEALLKERFERLVYHKEKTCETCDYFSERPCDVCESCANFGGNLVLHRRVERNGKTFLRLPFGDLKGVQKVFGDGVEFVNKLPKIPMVKPIRFIGKLRPYQISACKAMVKVHGGVLKSAPRTGKTVMAARVVCAKKQKTLILASQRDWLENFYETFVGSDTQPPMTDASKKRVGFAKKFEDFEKYDVALATYQTFLSPKGKKLLNKIKKMFSILIVDEVQTVPATEFSLVVSQLHCRHKFGLSGTPERKDGKEWTAYKLMGPVFYETRVEKLKPRVELVRTDFGGKVPQSWTYMIRKLETDPKRLKLIAKEAIKDVKAGHMVLIPFTRVPVIRALTQAINQLAGKKIAEPFYGGVSKEQRKATIERARNYECKVIVGNSRLLSTGINIPRASMLYEVTPSSNLPKAEQRFSRVCTPMEGKPQPVIKYFLDEFQLRKSCMRNEFFQVLWPKFRPVIRGDVKEALYAYLSNKKTRHHLGKGESIGGVL